MRTNIVINDDLMQQVMQGGQFQTKKEAVEEGLRLLVRQDTFRRILALRGKLELLDEPTKNVIKKRVRTSKNSNRRESVAT
jgi:Arc/MetJ family transcription regulator